MKRHILIHYGEIGLKRANIGYFVDKLRKRLKILFKKYFGCNLSIKYTLGRLMVDLPKDFNFKKDEQKYAEVIRKVFGIKNFKFVYVGSTNLAKLGKQIWANLPEFDPENRPADFKVSVKRSMTMPDKSFEMARDIGAILLENGLNMKVKLNDPEFVVDVEFFNDLGYFSYKKYSGVGGLSPNSQGRLVSLISSGIDSPVASYLMMKRGARVIFVHFHAYPYSDKDEMEHVKELVKMLSDYQSDTKLYLIPYGQIQRAIATNLDIPAKIRIVLYRRTMIRIAELITKRERAKGLVTGDNFGQVASQTPENLFTIHEASTIPIFQPLIGFDKEEIIKIAERIGTFEISKLPCKDTCSMFAPKHPELKANIYDVKKYEKNLPIQEWINKVFKEAEVLTF